MRTFNVLLHHGYCEDGSNAACWLNTRVEDHPHFKEHDCKGDARADVPEGSRYCPLCGKALFADRPAEKEIKQLEIAADLVRDFVYGTADSTDCDLVEAFEDSNWSPWGRPENGRFIRVVGLDLSFNGTEYFPEIDAWDAKFKK